MKETKAKKQVLKEEVLPSWDLSVAFYKSIDDPAIEQTIDSVKLSVKHLAKYEGTISTLTPHEFEMFVALYEGVVINLRRLFMFASLNADTQKNNQEATSFASKLEAELEEELDKIHFIYYELYGLEWDKKLEFLESPKLSRYRPWLLRVFNYTDEYPWLDEIMDFIKEKKSSTDDNWGRLYSEICAAMEFHIEDKVYNEAEIRNLMLSTNDPKIEELCRKELARVYKQHAPTLTFIFNSILKNEDVDAKLEGCYNAEELSSYYNIVPRRHLLELVTAVCDSFYPISRRYYALIDKMNKSPKCHSAGNPIIIPEKKYTWEECKKIVLEAYEQFSPDYAESAKSIIDAGTIDVGPKPGKKSGAYCAPGNIPYIFLNFMGKMDDLYTFAHELGHGVNHLYAAQRGILNDNTPISLAEVASEFAERMLFNKLFTDAMSSSDEDMMLYLTINEVGGQIKTIHRQIALYNFEKRAHRERQSKELSTERLGQIWAEEYERYTGIKLEGDERNEWMYVSHLFESPFYVYCYAFAGFIVNNLIKVWSDDDLKHKEVFDFARRFMDFLSNTGVEYYPDLLEAFELDPEDPDFWKNGLEGMVESLDFIEAMAKKKGLIE